MTNLKTTREEFLRDILIIAIEGGINYWAHIVRTKYADVYAVVNEMDSDEPKKNLEIDRETIERGIKLIVEGKAKVYKELRAFIYGANLENDASDIDAEGADCIIQAGLLGEIVYG